jgi:TRAP-type mannitol/chloroaromatic compound transport system permease large subunit
METLESRLQKRIDVSLYALVFLIGLLGLSILLEGGMDNRMSQNRSKAVGTKTTIITPRR